jgi:hypothetical protein
MNNCTRYAAFGGMEVFATTLIRRIRAVVRISSLPLLDMKSLSIQARVPETNEYL